MPEGVPLGSLMRVGCPNPNHPVHVVEYSQDPEQAAGVGYWRKMDDFEPLAMAVIGVSLIEMNLNNAMAADQSGHNH